MKLLDKMAFSKAKNTPFGFPFRKLPIAPEKNASWSLQKLSSPAPIRILSDVEDRLV